MLTQDDLVLALSNSGETDEPDRRVARHQAHGRAAGGRDRRAELDTGQACRLGAGYTRRQGSLSSESGAHCEYDRPAWPWEMRWQWPCSTPVALAPRILRVRIPEERWGGAC